MRNYSKKEKSKSEDRARSEYESARSKWAREQEEPFLKVLEKVGGEMELDITPILYVRAYKICVEQYKFGYPAEFKVASLIAKGEKYEPTLEIMKAVMKTFRIDFLKTRKNKN